MSHFLNNAYETAFAVHGFLERKSRGSGFLCHNRKSNQRRVFLNAPDSRLPGAHLSKAIHLPSRNSMNAERHPTKHGRETCASCSNVRRPVAKLFELKSQIGSPPRKLRTEPHAAPPSLSCLQPLFAAARFGRQDFAPNSRSATAHGRTTNRLQLASSRVCQPICVGQRQSARACIDTDLRHERDHLLSRPPHHFLGMMSGFLNPQAAIPVVRPT